MTKLRGEDWPRVKRVFDDALACDPAEWNAFLAIACDGDDALRRQVEELLAAHARAGGFLEAPARSVLNVPVLTPESASKLGPYHIEAVLAHGSMGVVYAGTHEATGVRAAVKTVGAPKADKLRQIRREIRALTRLHHPGVVRILDDGVEHGRPWYAMELLEHPTLAVWGKERHHDEKLGLIWRLCETLAYVHGEGVLHRDLKPRNILVTGRGLPVLVDFGLVGHVGLATGREVLDETRIAGSIAYMAPEQIAGDLLDPRTDLYAVGCILYELLTGHVPFEGNVREVVEQHRHRNPRPPSERMDGISPALDRLVLRLLAKQPRDRIAYATDVASALERLGVAAPPPYAQAPSARAYLCRPPLVGRDQALDQIDVRLSAASSGSGAFVLIEGESGVGKTRLALEAAGRATARGYQVIAGGATAVLSDAASGARSEDSPLQPLAPLLQAIADRCTEGGLETAERLLGERGPVLAVYAPALLQVPGQQHRPAPERLPAAHAQARLFRYLADTLAAYATFAPAIVLLDDLQWSDELTLGFLDYLARGRIATMPVVVIGAYRTEECGETLKSIARSAAVSSITLSRISPDDVSAMLGGMLSFADPPRGLARFLAEKSEGNPYFVTEYLRMAVSENVLTRNTLGQWIFADTADPTEVVCSSLPLPRSLRDVVDRRLRSLSPLAFRVMKCATVVGREVDTRIVQAAEALCDADASAAFDELASRHVVEPTDGNGCRFVHDKLREIPYSELPEGERRALHGRVAAAIERRYGDSMDHAGMHASLGRHWSAAGDPVRAIPHLHRAGDQAVALHALRDAIGFYREAVVNLETISADTEIARSDGIAIREKLADALSLGGMHGEARVELERALAACDSGKSIDRARLQRKIGKTLVRSRDHAGALAAYAAAEGILGAAADRPLSWRQEWVQVQLSRAWIGYWQGRSEEMAVLIERAGPYVHGSDFALERSLYYQALASLDLRRNRYAAADDTIEHARRAIIAAEEAHAAIEVVFSRFLLGFALLLRGALDDAASELGNALHAARRVGDVSTEVRCLAYLVTTHRRAQRIEETRRLAQEALGAATAGESSDYAAVAHAGLGWVAWRQGDDEDARSRCRTALESWNHPAFPFPFEWIARLTLLAIDIDRTPSAELLALAEPLLDPAQMRLPEAVESALQDAVACQRQHDGHATRDALRRVCAAAMRLGFL